MTEQELFNCYNTMGRVSSVDIATRYVIDGPGSNPGVGRRFVASVQTNTGFHPASCRMGVGSPSRG